MRRKTAGSKIQFANLTKEFILIAGPGIRKSLDSLFPRSSLRSTDGSGNYWSANRGYPEKQRGSSTASSSRGPSFHAPRHVVFLVDHHPWPLRIIPRLASGLRSLK